LADVSSEQRISHDETFGPVVSLSVFDGSEEEAVRLANDTPYGLGANVFTGDGERGARVAAQMHAGQVGINQYLGGAPGTPWVGARQSGFGFLGGLEGHRQFTWPKSVSRPV
jgi:acyl-CoA reductase-like NAD-dependent aldehyde dehydrogenase